MTSNQNIKHKDEVDIVDVILIIWKNKWTVIIATAFAALMMMIYLSVQNPSKIVYEARAEIKPISTFDEFEYEVYNSFIRNTGSKTVRYPVKIQGETFVVNELNINIDNIDSSFVEIDRKYLIDLFIEKINENEFLLSVIKKYGLIDKKNYQSNLNYENAIKSIKDSIKIRPLANTKANKNSNYYLENSWQIVSQTNDTENWEKFLNFLGKETNIEVQNYLSNSFNNLIINQRNIKKNRIEDLDLEIANSNQDVFLVANLKNSRQRLIEEKDIERLQLTFETTPIVTSNNFYAAKIISQSTSYKTISEVKTSHATMIILACVFGIIFGIIFALLNNAIRNRN